MSEGPIVATMIGDPCGIGPEIVVKALVEDHASARHLLVGDARAVAGAVALARAPFEVRAIEHFGQAKFEPGCLDVIDPGTLQTRDITVGRVSAACGRAVAQWWDLTTALAREGSVDAIVKAPVNSEAIRLAGAPAQAGVQPGRTYLFLITGPLRVVHLTDHIPLRQVFGQLRKDRILELIRMIDATLRRWGIASPRIGVAGINPHAHGEEEEREIAPAVEEARALGVGAVGPVPPDSLFRQCAEGLYDCVLAHYHDQGHIAVKTWRFEGNCAVMLGEPFLRVSVAHGTAFDIAGRGQADHRSMASALRTAAALAGGRGFPAA
jgi:4-phospho-D-threonate 3-dehydrogenase / 4-phospho-D-erythronate 3-dehydrogenase